ncbi:hypothetical protein GCM10010387_26050 [Streptomyces inusitatus]|uniref:Zinc-finger domain-containing protein n=1 Tax=Streptomyces inusitatus TaxID=68221 RepID=A0A918Q1Z9_9ACTN|nr:zf-HC2 domain-containing protein [Streptomyces inusitatus]GGZ31076.1 hypothetical protein GCM10010387_26050 [Streptomyces inusitatus]
MSGWHVSGPLAERYASGTAAEAETWSLEKHVETCGRCAASVSAAVRAGAAGPALDGIRAAVLAEARRFPAPVPGRAGEASPAARRVWPGGRRARGEAAGAPSGPPGPGGGHPPVPEGRRRRERVPAAARRAGLSRRAPSRASRPGPGPLARLLWAAGPALRPSWLTALALVLGGSLFLAYGVGYDSTRPLLLALSPALPLTGVAMSYGRYADPLHEIAASTPSGGLRLLLTRTAAVTLVSVPVLAAAGALLPPPATEVLKVPGPAAWLLPSLALTLAALALGSFVGCRYAALAVAGVWAALTLAPRPGKPGLPFFVTELPEWVSGPSPQTCWAAAAVVCAGLLAVRRSSFNRLETL